MIWRRPTFGIINSNDDGGDVGKLLVRGDISASGIDCRLPYISFPTIGCILFVGYCNKKTFKRWKVFGTNIIFDVGSSDHFVDEVVSHGLILMGED